MKHIRSLVLATLLSATVLGAYAQVPVPSPTPVPPAGTTTATSISHSTQTIKSIDVATTTFTLSTTKSHTYVVGADTKIVKADGTDGAFADLQVGMKVTVYYPKTSDATRNATKVVVAHTSTKPTAAPAATPAPATPATH